MVLAYLWLTLSIFILRWILVVIKRLHVQISQRKLANPLDSILNYLPSIINKTLADAIYQEGIFIYLGRNGNMLSKVVIFSKCLMTSFSIFSIENAFNTF